MHANISISNPLFTLGSLFRTIAGGAEQLSETNNLHQT